MKKSILLGLGACSLAMGGIASFVGQKTATEAKADDDTFTIQARFVSDSETKPFDVRIHLWEKGCATAVTTWENDPSMDAEKCEGYWLYSYDAPKVYDSDKHINRVIFRNGAGQTDDLWLGGYFRNCTVDYGFTLTMSKDNIEASEGYYSNVFDTSMARVWLNRNGYYNNNNYSYYIKANDKLYPARNYVQMFKDDTYWPYFDIPRSELDGKSLSYEIYETNSAEWYGYSPVAVSKTSLTYNEGDNVHYINAWYSNDLAGGTFDFNGTVSSVLASAFPKILEGYFTCLDNGDNGYGAFNRFASIWGTNAVNGNLSQTNLTDYAPNDSVGHGYDNSANKNTSYTCAKKIAEMEGKYAAVHASPSKIVELANDDKTSSIGIVFISVVAAAGIGGLFLLRKKRAE